MSDFLRRLRHAVIGASKCFSGKTQLIVSPTDMPFSYLELDDDALGSFARAHIIACEKAFSQYSNLHDLPLDLVKSMHGSLAIYSLMTRNGAQQLTLDHQCVTIKNTHLGNFQLIARRLPQSSTFEKTT
jgi:hypothetical protein